MIQKNAGDIKISPLRKISPPPPPHSSRETILGHSNEFWIKKIKMLSKRKLFIITFSFYFILYYYFVYCRNYDDNKVQQTTIKSLSTTRVKTLFLYDMSRDFEGQIYIYFVWRIFFHGEKKEAKNWKSVSTTKNIAVHDWVILHLIIACSSLFAEKVKNSRKNSNFVMRFAVWFDSFFSLPFVIMLIFFIFLSWFFIRYKLYRRIHSRLRV